MTSYRIGQRWISETEPELGLAIVEAVSRHRLELAFPASNAMRIYAIANAPIKRVAFRIGDSVISKNGATVVVDAVEEVDGLLTYCSGELRIPEAELSDSISFSKPEERLMNAQVDPSAAFALRLESLQSLGRARQSEVVGLQGGRIDLIPHQLFIATEIANRYAPRVLLADEVGLGKTIEACLILHRLILTGRTQRALILLPESLQHQWFIELLRRFNLWFTLCDSEQVPDGENPFLEHQFLICSLPGLTANSKLAAAALSAPWDLLIVDEAHHLEWTPKQASPEYALVEALAEQAEGLLLLTATPEQLGAEGHFARLRLLDPNRYPDLEVFKKEQGDYRAVAEVAASLSDGQKLKIEQVQYLRAVFKEWTEEEFKNKLQDPKALLSALVDRHGTGRVIFRNTREALQGFPERKALPVAIKPRAGLSKAEMQERFLQEFDWEESDAEGGKAYDFRKGPRAEWLVSLLRELGEAKVLLICRTKEKVIAIQEALQDLINVKAAVFHEDLSLLQRDRNAAWFADPEGARILLCSEIGSEGRNFQFAHHLVLFDIPLDPELLEQRIGRLDRIGQTETIKVYLPYLKGSCSELLVAWHHKGLGNIENSLRGGNAYLKRFGETIHHLSKKYHLGDPATLKAVDALIKDSADYRKRLEVDLARGQDKLIALNSFHQETANQLVSTIQKIDKTRDLDGFMNRIFDHFGVTVDDLEDRTQRVSPGQMFTDSFPGLSEEGTTVTFDRRLALSREDISFLTWDHPMVRGSIDLMLSSERGNSALVSWVNAPDAPPLLLEAVYVLETIAPAHLHVDRFLPPVPIRVVVDMHYEDRSEDFPLKRVQSGTRDEAIFRIQQEPELLQALLPQQLKAARGFARNRKSGLLEEALRQAHKKLDVEATRLKELRKVNLGVRLEEIELADSVIEEVSRAIAGAHLRLDAVRLIVNGVGSSQA
jgi:ATP-dependent helicase HepA